MPIKFGGTGACQQYGEMYTLHTFLIFRPSDFSCTFTEKKYSTISSA